MIMMIIIVILMIIIIVLITIVIVIITVMIIIYILIEGLERINQCTFLLRAARGERIQSLT